MKKKTNRSFFFSSIHSCEGIAAQVVILITPREQCRTKEKTKNCKKRETTGNKTFFNVPCADDVILRINCLLLVYCALYYFI